LLIAKGVLFVDRLWKVGFRIESVSRVSGSVMVRAWVSCRNVVFGDSADAVKQ